MSVAAEIWKHPLHRIGRALARVQEAIEEKGEVAVAAAESEFSSLVRQVFFPTQSTRRTHVLLASAGRETNILEFARSVGDALAEIAGANVALVDSHPASKLPSVLHGGDPDARFWSDGVSQITERLWHVPCELLPVGKNLAQRSHAVEGVADTLDFFLFAAQVDDTALPLFCSYCEGAVLVLTANRTRREAGLHAKRMLQQYKIKVIGAVLDGRQFPVPESIYRLL